MINMFKGGPSGTAFKSQIEIIIDSKCEQSIASTNIYPELTQY